MSHQPYTTWILSDEPLPPPARQELHAHLRTCEGCFVLSRRVRELDCLFKGEPPPAPAPGFAARFEARLARGQEGRLRRQFVAIFGAALLGAVLFLAQAVWQFLAWLPELHQIWQIGVQKAATAFAFLDIIEELMLNLVHTLPGPVLLPLWLCMFWLAGGALVLWATSLQRLAHATGGGWIRK